MDTRKVVTRDAWLKARKALLAQEKEHTRARDALSAARRAMPMVKVEKAYTFEGPGGKRSLLQLFGRHPQLVVYHFMLDPEWKEGCKSCSLIADNIDGAYAHFARRRDTAFVSGVSRRRACPTIEAFKTRMGWAMPWVSSFDCDFNYDFGVSFHTDGRGQVLQLRARPRSGRRRESGAELLPP